MYTVQTCTQFWPSSALILAWRPE